MKNSIVYICYSTPSYRTALEKNVNDVKEREKDIDIITYDDTIIDHKFLETYQKILLHPRGAGYWLWKPYIILKTLLETNYEYIIYCDSGSKIIHSVSQLILNLQNKDIGVFQLPDPWFHCEKRWTKRDIFLAMGCDSPNFTNTKQICATAMIFKKSNISIQFVQEWIKYACDYQLISDEPSIVPNYPEFAENRHDQSIFSLLCKLNKNNVHIEEFRYLLHRCFV